MNVTVYVPCYNAAEYLARSLDGILAQRHPADEVLVVDDGSRDNTCGIAARYAHVRIVRHEKNRGLSAARNTAFAAARNEWVAALDSDCVPEPKWLATLACRVEQGDVAGVGGRLVEAVRTTVADRWRGEHLRQDWGFAPNDRPGFLFGNNTLLRRSAVQAVGGYNPALRTNGEDVDISRRLLAAGYSLSYQPDAVAYHLRHDSVASAIATYWRYRRNHEARVTFDDVWKNWRYQYFGCARQALRSDLQAGRLELLPMDAWMLAYLPWLDFREAMKTGTGGQAGSLKEA
jgi:glycosyltransferase involved in cell wall biosynthesis